jgi:cytochrome c biogenesis protein ResB
MAQAEAASGTVRPVRLSDLPVWLWRLLASAQLAVALLAFLAVAGLVAVMVPQLPSAMRGNPAGIDAWLEVRRGDFGPFTDAMYRFGLFDVVRAWWFITALGLLGLSVAVYTLDRLADTWRSVTRPRERLADSFFERAANRVALATPAGAAAAQLEALLRRRRFRVRAHGEGDAVYLFADRFAWAQLGSFLSHGAIVLFLAGGLVSHFGGYTQDLLIAEGTTSPVFPVSHREQIQVEVQDAVARFDDEGRARDFRSELVLYQGGREVARGETTVNDPLTYGGYRFHQAGYLGEGAALRVRDVSSGNTRYQEVLALTGLSPAPAVTVRDAGGRVLLADVIVPTDFIEEARGTIAALPDGREYWVGVTPGSEDEWNLVVYSRQGDEARLVLREGAAASAGGLTWTFEEATGLPSLLAPGVPGDSDNSLVVLSETPEGEAYLTLLGTVDGRALTLYPDEPVRIGSYEYTFEGRREFAGISVRRDPGANFIWAAAAMLIVGLLVTFYVPRLRLWARVRPDETVIAAQAERRGVFQAETKRLLRELEPEEKGDGGA